MEAKPGKFLYMLIGGVVSTILLVIPCVNTFATCCFCIGVGAGGYLAFRMWIRSPRWMDEPQASSGDALVLGLGAGIFAAVLSTPINRLMELLLSQLLGLTPNPAEQAMYMDQLNDMYRNAGIDPSFLEWFTVGQDSNMLVMLVLYTFANAVIYGIFGAIWALIGANLFHKDQLA